MLFIQLKYITLKKQCQELWGLHIQISANKNKGHTVPLVFIGGGCGIRTHVTLLSNGFQDRLVMTASITLRIWVRAFAYFNILSQIWGNVKSRMKKFVFFSFYYCISSIVMI